MAKQLVNPLERHLEKAVVAVAALILILAIVRYGVTSPNKMELGGRVVTPRTVDAILAERSSDVLSRLRNAEADVRMPDPLADEFVGSVAPLTPAPVPPAAPFQPPVPIIDPPIDVVGRAKLVQVLPPGPLKLAHGRSTVDLRDIESEGPSIVATNWATVSAVFDYKRQIETQKRAYGATQDELLILPPEIQRRRAQPDGSWSEGDWEAIEPWPAANVPPAPELTLERVGREGRLGLPAEDKQALDQYVRWLRNPERQRDCLRPLMVPIVNGTQWKFPIFTSYRDVQLQDDQYLSQGKPSSGDPIDLYGMAKKAPAKPETELSPQQELDATLSEAESLLQSARKNKSLHEARRAYNLAMEVIGSRIASASQKGRAENLRRQADQTERDIKRDQLLGGGGVPAQPGGGQAQAVREPEPIQQVWAHDARDGSLENDATYQYRMRFRIYNQFAGAAEKFDDPNDATKVVLASEWSEPSEAIYFEPVSVFFVTYDDSSRKEIGVEFFRWYYGVWVKSRRERFGVGDRLSAEQRTLVPFIDDPTQPDNAPVEYGADRMVADIDFGRQRAERRESRGANGVSFGRNREDTAVILMTPDGSLSERYVSVDRDHPAKRDATAKVWSPPRP